MFKFRGLTDGNEWAYGNLINERGTDYIKLLSINPLGGVMHDYCLNVIPESLAVTYTGLTDKNGKQIYASFEVDGKMTRGGDIINGIGIIEDNEGYETEITLDNLNVQFDGQRFAIADYIKFPLQWYVNFLYQMANIEIIGKQWENTK